MKPVRIVLAIAVAAIIATVISSMLRNRAYNADGEAINRIIKELKSAGVPTTQKEFEQQYPQDEGGDDLKVFTNFSWEDAWNKEYRNLPNPLAMLYCGTSADLPTMRRYVAGSSKMRNLFFVKSKNLQSSAVAARLDVGEMDSVILDFGFCAYYSTLTGDDEETLKNLRAAIYLIHFCGSRPTFDHTVNSYRWRELFPFLLRIVEVHPSITPKVVALLHPARLDPRGILISFFVADVSAVRSVDSPLLDAPRLPKFFNRIHYNPTAVEQSEAGGSHDDDYMPQSRLGRALLRERLERWRGLMLEMAPRSNEYVIPDLSKIRVCIAYPKWISDDMAVFLTDRSTTTVGAEGFTVHDNLEAELSILRAVLSFKYKNGYFPSTLSEATLMTVPKVFVYQITAKGFELTQLSNGGSTRKPSFHHRIGYPAADCIDPRTLAIYKRQMERFHLEQHSKSGQNAVTIGQMP
ncbi:MAG: hypothetical protein JST12_09260 [Armatimonadetes bacterium]|nr:hypothetical protein [Armatimonadota bacterium]